jgi:large subunit ribosomal protein L15
MLLHQIKSPAGSRKRRKIVGRGAGSGHGKTSCRGHKGGRARSGRWSVGAHEGGQMRLLLRLPKVGFRPHRPTLYQVVNVGDLSRFKEGDTVTGQALKAKGLIESLNKPFKILGTGELKKKLNVQVMSVSLSAKEKIEKAGGKVEIFDKVVETEAKKQGPKK